MRTETRDFWTGLLLIAAAAALAGLYAFSSYQGATLDRKRLVLDATEVPGVEKGTLVKLAGYPVGSVEDVRLVATGASVRFEVDVGVHRDVSLHAGTRATLTTLLAGGAVVDLSPPGPGEEGAVLADGAHLALGTAPDVQDLLDRADRMLADAEATLRAVRVAVEHPEHGVDATLASLDGVLAHTDGVAVEADRAMRRADRMLAATEPSVAASMAALERALVQLEETSRDLDEVIAEADVAVADLDKTVLSYDPAHSEEMRRTLANLESASSSLERLMQAIEERPIRAMTKGTEAVIGPEAPTPAPAP
jgi:ABC-type transporter Mla subunit MlaD